MDERELLVGFDRAQPGPLARQLGDALRDAVRNGRLQPGCRLPATRTLAADLGVSRGVVVEAYEQLVAEGYVIGRAGGGTSVTNTLPAATAEVSPGEQHVSGLLDVRPGAPDLATFPRRQWLASTQRALDKATNSDLGYTSPWGVRGLRQELAHYLARVRGAVTTADDLIVTTGATQALTIMTRTLVRLGHRSLAVEDPSNAVQRTVLGSHGVRILNVPVDGDGIDVTVLERTGTRAVLVTPAHQFPTGVLMSAARREDLLRWATAVDGVIVEDDYDAEFRYDARPARCLQGAGPAHVALVGSVSKTLAPGLRLGWIRPPDHLVTAVNETKRDDDFGSDVITQLAFAELLGSGRYDKHLRAARGLYRRRREVFVQELRQRLPDWRIQGVAAGQQLTIELPRPLDAQAVADQARQRGLLILDMACMRGYAGPPALVLSFARLSGSQARHVVEVLAAAAAAAPADGVRHPRMQIHPNPGLASTVNAVDYFRPGRWTETSA